MPRFKEQPIDVVVKKQQQVKSQTKVFSSAIDNENILNDNEFNLLLSYQKAYFTDSLAKATIDLLLAPILQANYEIIIKDKKNADQILAKELVEYTLNTLYDSFSSLKNHFVFAIVVGCQYFEIVWNVEKYKDIVLNRIIRLVPIKTENIKSFLQNSTGDFIGLEVIDPNDRNIKKIYRDDLFYIIHNQIFNDPRGNSEIRAIIPLIGYKKQLLSDIIKTISRGVGVPVAYADTSLITDDNFEKYKTLLRNISANRPNSYALVDKNEIEKIDFLKVESSNVLPLLEFLNRDIFFNTLTQFLTTGLTQTGARATAEALKSPYALKISALQKEFEGFLQWLINIIIANSTLSLRLAPEDYPTFKFVNVTELDLQVFSSVLSGFVGMGLKLDEADLKYIKQLLKLPAPEGNKEVGLSKAQEKEDKEKHIQLRQNKINDFKIFEKNVVEDIYKKIEEDFDKIYNKIVKEIAAYIFLKQPLDVNNIIDKMYAYLESTALEVKKTAGESAVKEIKKIGRKFNRKLKYTLTNENSILQFIIKIVNIAQELKNKKGTTVDFEDFEEIENTLKEETKRERRDLIIEIEKEVQNGRGEVFRDLDGIKFKYTSMLDENVCQVCDELHDVVFTKQELLDAGLKFVSPINPNCLGLLGGNSCRCQLIPVEGE